MTEKFGNSEGEPAINKDKRPDIIQPEKKELPVPREIWIVEDQHNLIGSVLRSWKSKLKDRPYDFKVYETARAALDEITHRIEKSLPLPTVIFIDYELEKDTEELSKGSALIENIRNLKDITQPTIIAHSAQKEFNDQMLAAGADYAFKKSEAMKSGEFLMGMDN